MVSIVSLPIEMLFKITGYLDQASRSRLSRTCICLHRVVTPELYRNITIDLFYHPSTANETNYLSVATPSRGGGRGIQSPFRVLRNHGEKVKNLTIRVSRMPSEWTKTQARRSRVSMKWIKESILLCPNTAMLRLFSGSDAESGTLPETIYQPYRIIYSLLGIAETAILSFRGLKEVVVSGLSDVDSFSNGSATLKGPCDLTLSTLGNIRLKINERDPEEKYARWKQISDAFDGVRTTIHFGNIDPASRRYRFGHPNLSQLDGWKREVKRFDCTVDALSPDSPLNFDPGDVRSLNILAFPTNENLYREVIPRIMMFQGLVELWVSQYQTVPRHFIPWEEIFPELFKHLPTLEGITHRRFFRDSDKQHKSEWRMVETRFKANRSEGTVVRYGSIRDEYFKIW
ncbi:hypothetical protein TWF718_000066 [Orbilia javanica]|uniref:F-box domain-containing protein n=1 Tax=Orbilia javanica TaxID=47235 RepID=A0AAN8MWL6_9PEZI